jgi:hypothetical protein
MIGKTKTGKSFKGVLYYCLNEKKNAEILDMNGLSRYDAKGLTTEFEAIHSENLNVSTPVWHSSLSFHESDKITNEKMKEIANRFMEKSGFNKDNYQWVIIKHNDKAHKHCHIVANRVGFDGKAVSDSFYKTRSVGNAKELEKEYGLKQAQEISREQKRLKELNQTKDFTRDQLKDVIDKAIKQPGINNLNDLATELKSYGIDMNVLHHSKTGKEFGVTFKTNNSKTYKGSDIGKNYALKALMKLLPPELKLAKTIINTIQHGISM